MKKGAAHVDGLGLFDHQRECLRPGILANATRTAEKIFVRYFGGDSWIGRESPVSSVDDTVTQAVLAAGL